MTESEGESRGLGVAPPPGPAVGGPAGRRDVTLVFVLLVLTLLFRHAWAPQPSGVFPGIMRPAGTGMPYTSDSPSMDEVWDLALSAGRGSPLDHFPRDTLLRQVPALTTFTADTPWWKVWGSLDGIIHPPLYFQTLRFWRAAFGPGDGVAILYSVAWSCVAVVFIYLAVRPAAGRAAAFWSGALFAAAPVANYFGLEIRGYAMLTAESAIALWLLVRLTLFGPRWRDVAGLGVTFLACMLTHYFAAPACFAGGVYAMAIGGRRWKRALVACVTSGLVYLAVWLPFFLRQAHLTRDGTDYAKTASPQPWVNLRGALLLPLRLLAEIPAWDWWPAVLCGGVLVMVTVLAVKRPAVRPFVLWHVAVAGFLLVTDVLWQTQQVSFIRYSAAAEPAAVAFVPVLAACVVRRAWATHVAGVMVCALALYTQQVAICGEAPTFTPAALSVVPLMAPDDVLVIHAAMLPGQSEIATVGTLMEFSRFPGCFPRDAMILYHPMTPQMITRLAGRHVWLLSFNVPCDPTEIVPGAKVVGTARYEATTTMLVVLTAYRLELPTASAPSSAPAATAPR